MANTRKRFSAQISVPTTQELYDRLNEIADQNGQTVAHITRTILEKVLGLDRANSYDFLNAFLSNVKDQ